MIPYMILKGHLFSLNLVLDKMKESSYKMFKYHIFFCFYKLV